MANGYSPQDKKTPGLSPIAGITAGTEISGFGVTAGGAKMLRVDVRVSGVTVVGSITLKLQHSVTGSDVFVDLAGANASVAVTADGIFSLTQLAERSADQANLPLRKQVRVVAVTTDGGDELTVDNVYVSMPL